MSLQPFAEHLGFNYFARLAVFVIAYAVRFCTFLKQYRSKSFFTSHMFHFFKQISQNIDMVWTVDEVMLIFHLDPFSSTSCQIPQGNNTVSYLI